MKLKRVGKRSMLMLILLIMLGLTSEPNLGMQRGKAKPMPDESTAVIKHMKSVAVQITYKSDARTPWANGVAGTGFLVSAEGYAITAGHVVSETTTQLTNAGATRIEFFVNLSMDPSSTGGIVFRGSFITIGCTIVEVDTPHDVALIRLGSNPFKGEVKSPVAVAGKGLPLRVSVARFSPQLPPEGTLLLVSGYPLSIPTMVTQRGIVASESFRLVESQPPGAPPGFKFPEIADAVFLDVVVNPGNSGGPVYLADSGYVVGICQGNVLSPLRWPDGQPVEVQRGNSQEILQQNAGIATVIPIKYAITLLEKNKIRF